MLYQWEKIYLGFRIKIPRRSFLVSWPESFDEISGFILFSPGLIDFFTVEAVDVFKSSLQIFEVGAGRIWKKCLILICWQNNLNSKIKTDALLLLAFSSIKVVLTYPYFCNLTSFFLNIFFFKYVIACF